MHIAFANNVYTTTTFFVIVVVSYLLCAVMKMVTVIISSRRRAPLSVMSDLGKNLAEYPQHFDLLAAILLPAGWM